VIAESEIPPATNPLLQHALETYASEINKTASVFAQFAEEDSPFRPHPRSMTVLEIFRHQLLSERRFFGEFLGSSEPDGSSLFPAEETPEAFASRVVEWRVPDWHILRRRTIPGGLNRARSSMWNGKGSGFSGGACCIRHTTGHS